MGIIYKITNKTNGKMYIGKTEKTLEERWQGHLKSSKKPSKTDHFHQAIKKYGQDNFILETLETCPSNKLDEREKYYIKTYHSRDPEVGYNIASGGTGGILWREGNHPSLGRKMTGADNPFYGRKHTLETRQKISQLNKNRPCPNKGKIRIHKENLIKYISEEDLPNYIKDGWYKIPRPIKKGTRKGWKQSDYQKKIASLTHKGKKVDPKTIEKVQFTMKSKSPEQLAEISKHKSESQKKLRWVTNDVVTIRIHSNELETYLQKGFKQGRKRKEEN